MDNNKLVNAGLGTVINMFNTDEDLEGEFDKYMNMTVEEAFMSLLKEMPKVMLKLRLSTVFDILSHGADLEDYMDDLDLDEDDED